MQELDFKEMIKYISEQTDIREDMVEEVLESEEDYLYSQGLIEYDRDELVSFEDAVKELGLEELL